jgi:hypothetical protein
MISGRYPKFTRKFWKELFHQVGTSLAMITSYHPQIDGHIEVANKCLEWYLTNFLNDH